MAHQVKSPPAMQETQEKTEEKKKKIECAFTPVADAYWCMAEPIQYFKVKNKKNKKIKNKLFIH